MPLKVKTRGLNGFVSDNELLAMAPQVETAHNMLHNKSGLGNDFLGWLKLPCDYDNEEYARIKKSAEKIKSDTDVLIVIGIGGSYLGARAAIQFIKSEFYNKMNDGTPEIYFVGNNISSSYLTKVLKLCEGKDLSVNVISKSGTTTEPAIAFRIFKNYLEQKYGESEAAKRIYATTDKSSGVLKELATSKGYESFVVPDDIGGRFSVLTAVGLLPIAACGVDIDAIMQGALMAQKDFDDCDIQKNDCYKYAALRNILYRKGKTIEVLAAYEPDFFYMAEWFKQLYGESEGKDHKGIFPTSVIFSTDLHSMGQYIQDGRRDLFETVVSAKNSNNTVVINKEDDDADGLNFLAGETLHHVNQKAYQGTLLAHTDGGVPNIVLEYDNINEFDLGYMIYFFEKACAISGYLLGVNPFDQPGVEAYKKNMFALLGKKGYENLKNELEARL